MKRYGIVMMMVAVAAMVCGCNSEERQQKKIRESAMGYLMAMGNYRFDEAIPYSSAKTCERTIPTMKAILEMADTTYINSNMPAEIRLGGIRMTSSTTARIAFHKHTPITEQYDTLNMVKEDGKWLAEVIVGAVPGLNVGKDGGQMRAPQFSREMLEKLSHDSIKYVTKRKR